MLHFRMSNFRCFSSSLSSSMQPVIGICREEGSVWERRAPMSPSHVGQLVREGFKVLVQPSSRRAYAAMEYQLNGAMIQEDLSEAQAIFGVKIIPPEHILPNKRYAFFSHTIKAQAENMKVLDTLVEKKVCFMDYETMVNDKGARLVAFGRMAGVAGMINILHGLGLRLLSLGYHTPFMHVGCAHNYSSLSAAKAAISNLGRQIQYGLLPDSLGPMVFTFTGAGKVSQGAQEIFQELPYEYVSPKDLKGVIENGNTRTLYATVVDAEDHLEHVDGHEFVFKEFMDHPEKFRSSFNEKIIPYTTCLVNGIYWAPGCPRLLTAKQCQQLQSKEWDLTSSFTGSPKLPQRLLAISDISADINGSIEFMSSCTSIDSPFVLYDAHTGKSLSNTMSGPGVVVSSIDNLPTQLPLESTNMFGAMLLPYIKEFLKVDPNKPLESQEDVSHVIRNALITHQGNLTTRFQYIEDLRKQQTLENSTCE